MLRKVKFNLDSTDVHDKGVFCAYLSMLAYLPEKQIIEHLEGISINNIVVNKVRNLEYFYYIVNSEMFIVIRGTDTDSITEQVRDIITSIRVRPSIKKDPNHIIHTGYYKAGEALYKELKNIIDIHDGGITFCGHSMGGVLATYVGIRSDTMCDIFTFGAPSLASSEFYKNRSFKRLVKYVNNKDLIPSYGSRIYSDYLEKVYKMNGEDEIEFVNRTPELFVKPLLMLIFNKLFGKTATQLQDHSIKRYYKSLYTFIRRKQQTEG